MRYVVVGSGPAGISAAEEIRKIDPVGPISMISADTHPAYSPVMLTYWMSGHYPKERLFFREMGSWAQDHQVDLRCGKQVTAIDVHRQAVTLSPGEEIAYDRLLIATGAVPLIPPIPGIRAKGVCTFRTFADAEEILTSRRDMEQVCIMGGGFIGIKLACHLRERGLSVLVVEKEPRLASRIFDQRASDIVKEQLRGHGISVETGTGITEISNRDGWVSGVLIGFILIGDTSRAGLFLSRMKRGDIIGNPAELFTRISHAPSGLLPYMGFRHGSLWPRCKDGVCS